MVVLHYSINMLTVLYLTISMVLFNGLLNASDISTKFQISKDACELIARHGYPSESHTIVTKDGYILNLQRIPGRKHGIKNNGLRRPPVLLMHGLMATSMYFLNYGTDKSLAFFLADQGFDVWLGNARGTFHGRKHMTMKQSERQFWNFTWHEIGVYDLPTIIDYVLEKTNERDLFYIGHSQGTTAFFVLGSELPEYNEKIRLMVAMAPSALVRKNYQDNYLVKYIFFIEKMANMLGIIKFDFEDSILSTIYLKFCNTFPSICVNVLHLSTGFVTPELNTTVFDKVFLSFPGGNSLKQLYHYAQLVRSDKFQQYDHGELGNLVRYQNETPPEYNLSKVTAPVALYFGDSDFAVHHEDVEKLILKLPNVYSAKKLRNFNHLDFLWAKDIKNRLYYQILSSLRPFLT